MIDCDFGETRSDAFDGDFVRGSVTDTSFREIGGDAIDVSGATLQDNADRSEPYS